MGRTRRLHRTRRPAVAVVMTVVLLGVILGFAALTVDLGVILNTQHDLQNAADAAALSGVSAYALDLMHDIRRGTVPLSAFGEIEYTARTRAIDISKFAPVLNTDGIEVEPNDITLGWLDITSPSAELRTDVPESSFNAVRVTTRRTEDSVNGPAELYFARAFNVYTADVVASATAVFVRGRPEIDIWPFTISRKQYESDLASGDDSYSFDEGMFEIRRTPDGLREVHLFPNREAPGNFGALTFGTSSSSDVLSEFIRDGVDDDSLVAAFGLAFPTFVDEYGEPTTYEMTGNPGMSWSIKTDVDVRVGDVVVIFLHDGFVLNEGSNATYSLVDARHVRVMAVDYKNKGLWVQPVEITGDDSEDLIGHPVLAR